MRIPLYLTSKSHYFSIDVPAAIGIIRRDIDEGTTMTRPALHLVVSDRRNAEALAAGGGPSPRAARPGLYDAVEFGGGWYHEAAIAEAAPRPVRTADVVPLPRRGAAPRPPVGLTLLS